MQFCLNWEFSHKHVFHQSMFEKLTSVSEVVLSHINQTTVWKPKLWKIKYPKVRKCPTLSMQGQFSLLECQRCNCSHTAFVCRSHLRSRHRGQGQLTSMGSPASALCCKGPPFLLPFFFFTPSLLLHFSTSLAFGSVSAGQAKATKYRYAGHTQRTWEEHRGRQAGWAFLLYFLAASPPWVESCLCEQCLCRVFSTARVTFPRKRKPQNKDIRAICCIYNTPRVAGTHVLTTLVVLTTNSFSYLLFSPPNI